MPPTGTPLGRTALPTRVVDRADYVSLSERMAADYLKLGADQRTEQDTQALASLIEVPEMGGVTGATGYEGMLESPEGPYLTSEAPEPTTAFSEAPARRTALMGIPEAPALAPLRRPQPVPEQQGQTFELPGTEPGPLSSFTVAPGGSGAAGAPGAAAPGTGAPPAGGEIEAHIRRSAATRKIDPDVAVRVALSEGGLTDPVRQSDVVKNGVREPSYGPFQLYLGGGLGNAALKAGIDPRNPAQWREAIDFALDNAAQSGWGQWYGAGRVGIGNRQGIGTYEGPVPAAPAVTERAAADRTATGERTAALEGITPPQFGLGDADADAICGPVLAMAFAKSNGRNPTIAEAKQMAATHGRWTSAQGMGGPEAMAQTLRAMEIPATYKPGPLDVETIRRETTGGNPVGINTRGHYFVVEGVDAQGRLNLGNSARALKSSGGRTWFTPGEIEGLGMGAPTGAIYKDSPASPTPSVAVSASGLRPVASEPTRQAMAPQQRMEHDALSLAALSDPGTGAEDLRVAQSPLGYSDASYTSGEDVDAVDMSYAQRATPPPAGPPVRDDYRTEVVQPYDPDQGPREALPGSVGATPYLGPLSPEPEPVALPPSPLASAFRPDPLIGQPAPPMPVSEAPPSWERRAATAAAAAAAPVVQSAAAALGSVAPALGSISPGITAATAALRAAPSVVTAATPVVSAALDTYNTANEWLINNPVTGQLNPQAWGRELGGTDQLHAEVGEDLTRLQALIRRYQAGDTSVEAEMRALNDSINARVAPSGVSNRDVLLAAGERNPNKTAENLGQAVQAGATLAIAPSLAAGPGRNIVGAALDPIGQGLGAALELPGQAIGAARRVQGALGDNAQRVAAADARMAHEGSTTAPGVFGAGPVPDPAPRHATVEVLVEQLDATNAVWQAARRGGDEPAMLAAREQAVQLEAQLADALNARRSLEPAITSDVGRRVETVPLAEETADTLSGAGARRGAILPEELSGPVGVPVDMGGRMNASAGALAPGARGPDAFAGVNRVLGQGLLSGVSGTTGGLVNQELNPDDPYAFATGFGAAALGIPAAQRGARALARAAGAAPSPGGGALSSAGGIPPPGAPPRPPSPPMAVPPGQPALPPPAGAGRSADDLIMAAHRAVGVPERAPSLDPGRFERWRRGFVRAWTDNRVDTSELQKSAQKELGRSLTGEEMLHELTRVNPSGAARVAIGNQLRPIMLSVDSSRPVITLTDSAGNTVQLTEAQVLSRMRELTNNRDVAAALGAPDRRFPGGLTGAESDEAARALLAKLPRESQIRVGQANNAITDIVDRYRERLVDAGVWSRELGDDLKTRYPNWIPTRILDFMRDTGHPGAATMKSVSLGDRHLRAYSLEGTDRMREDGMASLVRYIQQAEEDIAKNDAFNAVATLRDEVPAWRETVREVPMDAPVESLKGEKAVTGFVDGERRRFIVPEPMAAAIQMEQQQGIPLVSALTRGFRELITRTPAFVAGQVPLDAASFIVRETAREGGPTPRNVARVVGALAGGYKEAFRGLFDGTFKGDTAEYLRSGGGMAGYYQRSAQSASTALDDISRRSMFEIRSPGDLAKTATWLALQGPTQAVGERVELAPRTASYRLGLDRAIRRGEGAVPSEALVPEAQAGAGPGRARTAAGTGTRAAELEAMTGARDVTLDFQRGGNWAMVANQAIPFFNVGVQGSLTPYRAFKQNPAGFASSVVGLVGAPMLAIEAWNRSDPQRAQDYEEVPDYVKDRGLVIMTGQSWTDKEGNRHPYYALWPTRELSPFVIFARELAGRAVGDDDPRAWSEVATAMGQAAAPIQASSASDLFSTATPLGASTALQLAQNRDYFRDRNIATERADREAGVVAHGISALAGENRIRPSQAEFALRDLTGNVGAALLAGADQAASLLGRIPEGAEPKSLERTAVAGSVGSRFVGSAIGQGLQTAEDAMVSPGLSRVLGEAGLRNAQVSGVGATGPGGFPFTRAEQAAAQQRMNQYLADVATVPTSITNWGALNERARQTVVRDRIDAARRRAEAETMNQIPEAERSRRFAAEQQKRTGR